MSLSESLGGLIFVTGQPNWIREGLYDYYDSGCYRRAGGIGRRAEDLYAEKERHPVDPLAEMYARKKRLHNAGGTSVPRRNGRAVAQTRYLRNPSRSSSSSAASPRRAGLGVQKGSSARSDPLSQGSAVVPTRYPNASAKSNPSRGVFFVIVKLFVIKKIIVSPQGRKLLFFVLD